MVFLLAALLTASVAEIASFTDADYRANRGLTLTGRVTAMNDDTFVLSDDTGNALVRIYANTNRPAIGDIVTANCFGVLIDDTICQIFTKKFTVTGHVQPAPPQRVTVSDIAEGRCDNARVRLRARVINVLDDTIEPSTVFLHLTDGTNTTIAAYWRDLDAQRLIDAEVEVDGLVMQNIGQWRRFQGRGLINYDVPRTDYVRIVVPPPADPFAVPEYSDRANVMPQELAVLGRRAVTGRVRAVWHGDRFLIETRFLRKRFMQVSLAANIAPPAVGQAVKVIGLPRTDLFSIQLEQAIWKAADETDVVPVSPETPQTADAHTLLTGAAGKVQIQAPFHGRLVRMTGSVISLPSADWTNRPVLLNADGETFPIDASSCPTAFDDVTVGCTVEVTGVCLLQTDPWQPGTPVTDTHGFTLVIRSPADIRVLARPPWWTPARLLIVLGVLFAVTVFFFVWNRILRRLVIRRSRELAREQIARDAADLKVGERTRLAVELHDSLSQNLEGLACQVSALEGVLTDDPETARGFLTTARQMLSSCRAELRSCLFDLRGHALEASTFTEALRTTLKPFSAATAAVSIRFDVRTSLFNDTTVHAVLCIVRELTANAIRHGHAAHVRVAGEYREERLRFSVEDDGIGFDPSTVPGIEAGHFGLSGVRTRVERLGGTLELTSTPGQGTYARVTIPMKTP